MNGILAPHQVGPLESGSGSRAQLSELRKMWCTAKYTRALTHGCKVWWNPLIEVVFYFFFFCFFYMCIRLSYWWTMKNIIGMHPCQIVLNDYFFYPSYYPSVSRSTTNPRFMGWIKALTSSSKGVFNTLGQNNKQEICVTRPIQAPLSRRMNFYYNKKKDWGIKKKTIRGGVF